MKGTVATLALLAGCGGELGPAIVDAAPMVDADGCSAVFLTTCNPISQTGCEAGQKCTWQHVTDTQGVVACVPDGTTQLGGECTFLPPGETAGYDDCVGGTYCRGVCKEICVDAPDSCPLGTECTVYPGIFECSFSSGLCEPL